MTSYHHIERHLQKSSLLPRNSNNKSGTTQATTQQVIKGLWAGFELQFVNQSQIPPEEMLENDLVSFCPTLTISPFFDLLRSFTLTVSTEKGEV